MSLNLEQADVSGQIQKWWIVNQREPGLIKKSQDKFEGLEVYIFSDQVSPPSLGFLAGYGYVMTFYSRHFFNADMENMATLKPSIRI